MKKYNVITRNDDLSKTICQKIKERLTDQTLDEKDPNTVFVVGGDGTFLIAVHQYLDKLDQINFIAIHTGTLGFFTDYQAEEIDDCLNDYLNKEPQIDKAQLLDIDINKQKYYAVNEMRIENVYKTQMIDVYLDDDFFETFRGTGLCISTQLGSTAYNRSLGGAIITKGLPLLQLSEITGIHHHAYRSLGSSIILNGDCHITLKGYDYDKAVMCYDHKTIDLYDRLSITCYLSDKYVRFARYKEISYLKRLNSLF